MLYLASHPRREVGFLEESRNLPPGHRALRLGNEATRSLVLASAGPRERLEQALPVLVAGCAARQVELVVARSCSADEYHALEHAFPTVLFMPVPDGSSLRQMRAIGLSAADGDIVTLMDDLQAMDDAALETLLGAPRAATAS